ncbi:MULTISPECIES: helix-turn-helix domain-containing protein [unclassified Bradyrhizobium]|uniref:helix-turn-helix domain-containing protein n=1 Tax=unclassified Bradyrhizobium TaxID=2631580 RepID=UPI0039657C9D
MRKRRSHSSVKKRGLSQDDLAKRAGITQGNLSEIEVGRKSGDDGDLCAIGLAVSQFTQFVRAVLTMS